MNPLRIPLRVVFYQADGEWVAHSLEFDLVGVGQTRPAAMELLVAAIGTQICESLRTQNLRNLFSPADGEYFQMFAEGEDVAAGELKLAVESPPTPDVVIERTEARVFQQGPRRRADCSDLVLA